MMDVESIYQSKLSVFRNAVVEESSKCGAAASLFEGILDSIEERMGVSSSSSASYTADSYAASNYTANTYTSGTYLNDSTGKTDYTSQDVQEAIEIAANKTGLDPDLLRAVIQTESSFDVDAVSGCGAKGLMQLMPGTAKDMGVKDSFDPYQNVYGGAKYLKKMLNRFGDIRLALAAYNKGPGKIHSLGITDADDAEQYSKLSSGCRGYIRKILRLYEKYKNE
jgi:soluble lytic murein transglycosylase-like protein